MNALVSQWKSALAKTAPVPSNERQLAVLCRLKACALSALASFLKHCSSIVNPKVLIC